jgi:AAA-like domain
VSRKDPAGSARRRLSRSRLTGEKAIPALKPDIRLRSVDGHIARTTDTVWAWYRLAPQRWSFRTDAARHDLITAIALQYAELQGRWLHLRVTSSPWPVTAWARAHTDNALGRPADIPGALSFDDYLVGEQQQLMGRSMAEKEVYLGVEVQARGLVDAAVQFAQPVLRKIFPSSADAELAALDDEIERIDQTVGSAGLEGTPVSPQEMRWLLARSCALGLPAPPHRPVAPRGQWGPEDMASVTDLAELCQEPYDTSVTVTGRSGPYAGLEHHTVVLSVGLMHGLQIPEVDDPWAQHADRLPGAVEWSARIYVRRPGEVEGELGRQMNKVRSQQNHHIEEHGIEPPQSLTRQYELVRDIEDQMTTGFTSLATRVKSWWRVAVSAPTSRDALSLARRLADLYSPKVIIEHPEGQYLLAREFIPGEPLATSAHLRRGSVLWAAAAVPAATAEVGDRRGILLGETCTATRRPVAWDPWMAQEIRDGSGLTAMIAGLGGGKSFLGGGIVYKTVRAGAHWTILDPSGPLARLCDLPELRPYSRKIDLLNAQPGILNPYRVVPEPQLAHFADEDDPQRAYQHERSVVAATRRRLVLDVLTGLLPYEVARLPETRIVLLRAVRAVGGAPDRHPGLVISALAKDNTEHAAHARAVADFLDEMRERMALLIPDRDADPYAVERDDRLTVLTMAGLPLPRDGVEREHWTDSEALGVELLNLSAWLTQRSVYDRPKELRKGVWIDEAFFLSEVPTGRVLMNRFARDSRKWNVRVLLSSQIPADFLRIRGFVSLLDSVFVGRLDDDEVQADALRLLKVPQGIGYEPVIASLGRRSSAQRDVRDVSPREFVFADGAGGVERIRIDFSGPHLTHLRQVLDTTPQPTPPAGLRENVDEPTPAGTVRAGSAHTPPPAATTAGPDELDVDLDALTAQYTPAARIASNGHAPADRQEPTS